MTTDSQTKQIFDYLMGGSSLTGLQAIQLFGSIKCSNRIGEIEKQYGVTVDRRWKEVRTRFGKKTVKEYFIKQKLKR